MNALDNCVRYVHIAHFREENVKEANLTASGVRFRVRRKIRFGGEGGKVWVMEGEEEQAECILLQLNSKNNQPTKYSRGVGNWPQRQGELFVKGRDGLRDGERKYTGQQQRGYSGGRRQASRTHGVSQYVSAY